MKDEKQMNEIITKVLNNLQQYKSLQDKMSKSISSLNNLYDEVNTSAKRIINSLQYNIDDLNIVFDRKVLVDCDTFFGGFKKIIERDYNKRIKSIRETERNIELDRKNIFVAKNNSILTNDFSFDNDLIFYILSHFSNPDNYSIYKNYVIHREPIYYQRNEENYDEAYIPILHYSKKLGLFILKITFINKKMLGFSILQPKKVAMQIPSEIRTIDANGCMINKYFREANPFIGDRFVKTAVSNQPFDSIAVAKIIIELLDGFEIIDFKPYIIL